MRLQAAVVGPAVMVVWQIGCRGSARDVLGAFVCLVGMRIRHAADNEGAGVCRSVWSGGAVWKVAAQRSCMHIRVYRFCKHVHTRDTHTHLCTG